MAQINKQLLEQNLLSIGSNDFQELGIIILEENGYQMFSNIGSQIGSNKTVKGTPDVIFLKNGKKVLCQFSSSTDKSINNNKIIDDVKKCVNTYDNANKYYSEIIYFYNSREINESKLNEASKIANEYGFILKTYNFDQIIDFIVNNQFTRCLPLLNVKIVNNYLSVSQFIKLENNKIFNIELNNTFIGRIDEQNELKNKISQHWLNLVSGKPGVGKTRLVLEVLNILKSDYKILCYKNLCNNSLNEVCDYLYPDKKAIIFVDDINNFNRQGLEFIDFINSLNVVDNYDLKIVATIRDAYLNDIISSLDKKYEFSITEIKKLNKEEIELLIKKNNLISDSNIIKRIVNFSNGNPRIALSSYKIISDNNCLDKVDSFEKIEDYLYESYFEKINKFDDNIIHFLYINALYNVIDLKKLDSYKEWLDFFSISEEKILEKYINYLENNEIISKRKDYFSIIDDENFKDYIVNHMIFKNGINFFESIIKNMYINNRSKIIKSINNSLYIFNDNSKYEFLKEAVSNILKESESKNKKLYDCLLNDFYLLFPEKYIFFIGDYIGKIKSEPFNPNEIKETGSSSVSYVYELVSLLWTKYRDVAFELLINLSNKNSNYFIAVCKILNSNYFINKKDSEIIDFSNLFFVSNKLLNKLEFGTNYYISKSLCNFYLRHNLDYSYLEGNLYKSTSIPVTYDNAFIKSREILWKLVMKFNEFDKIHFASNYFNYFDAHIDDKMFDIEYENITNVLLSINKTDNLNYIELILLKNKEKFKNHNKEFNDLLKKFKNKNFKLFKEIISDYGNYDDEKNKIYFDLIRNFSDNDFLEFISIIKGFEKLSSSLSYILSSALNEFLRYLNNDEMLMYMFDLYNKNNKRIINKNILISKMIEMLGKDKTYELINQNKCDECLNSYFLYLEKNLISEKECDRLYSFLQEIDDRFLEKNILDLYYLKKFSEKNKNIIPKILDLIISNYNSDCFKSIKLMEYLIFDLGKELNKYINLNNVHEIIKITMNIIYSNRKENNNLNGFIIHLLSMDYKCVIDMLIEKYNNLVDLNLAGLWSLENYNDIASYILEKIKHSSIFSFYYKYFFGLKECESTDINDNQFKWITTALIKCKDRKEFDIIGNLIHALKEYDKYSIITEFLKNNDNKEDFICLIESIRGDESYSGSYSSVIFRKIKLLENLKRFTEDSNLIFHTLYLKDKINDLNELSKECDREYFSEQIETV